MGGIVSERLQFLRAEQVRLANAERAERALIWLNEHHLKFDGTRSTALVDVNLKIAGACQYADEANDLIEKIATQMMPEILERARQSAAITINEAMEDKP